MRQLLTIEWIKLRKLRAFHIIAAIYLIAVPAWMFAMNEFFGDMNTQMKLFPTTKVLWSFPTVWRFVTWSASWLTFALSVVIIISTTQEFANRTLRQHIIDGLTQRKVIFSKFIVILMLTAFATLVVFITGLAFGMSQSKLDLYTNMHYVGFFAIQTLCYFGFAFFLAILIKRPALAILIYMAVQLGEAITGLLIPKSIYAFFPMNNIALLTPRPFLEQIAENIDKKRGTTSVFLETWQTAVIAVFVMVILYFISYYRLKRRDL